MRVFLLPEAHVTAARALLPMQVHLIDDRHVVSAAGAELLATKHKALRGLVVQQLDVARWDATVQRLHAKWAASVSEPLPDNVTHEARLMLYGDPALELEFMGRGNVGSDAHLPARRELLVALDAPGGRRVYLFRRLQRGADGHDARIQSIDSQYADVTRWLQAPDSRVVVSIGGGGFRMFAAIPVLKMIDRLAGRERIAEVWGSSGGAFVGFAFAAGIPLEVLDQFAFDLYNGRARKLSDGSWSHIVRSRVLSAVADLRGRERPPDMVDWLAELERRCPTSTRGLARPFFAIASSNERVGLTALTGSSSFAPSCSDFMIACDPHKAVAASTAVPFVLRAVRGIGDRPQEAWFDGSISDENPLALPYIKWLRERAADPERTPNKLKIVLVNLNLRARESSLLRMVDALPVVGRLGLVGKGARVLDMLLDSKTSTNIRLVTATPGVEVLSVTLNLGWLSVQGPREIARAVRSGRTLDAWEIQLHAVQS